MNIDKNLVQYFRQDDDNEEIKGMVNDFEEVYNSFYDEWKNYKNTIIESKRAIRNSTNINFSKLNSLNDKDKVKYLIGQIQDIKNKSQIAFDNLCNEFEVLEMNCSNVFDSMVTLYSLSQVFSGIDDIDNSLNIHTSYQHQIHSLKEKAKGIYHQGYQDGYDMKVEELDDDE